MSTPHSTPKRKPLKKILRFLLLAIALTLLIFVGLSIRVSKGINFESPSFERAVRHALDIPSGPVSYEVAASTTLLYLYDDELDDIEDIKHFKNLIELDILTHSSFDITPLAPLTKLSYLSLEDNNTTCIAYKNKLLMVKRQ